MSALNFFDYSRGGKVVEVVSSTVCGLYCFQAIYDLEIVKLFSVGSGFSLHTHMDCQVLENGKSY